MKVREQVNTHLPSPGSNKGGDPGVFVQTPITLPILGGRTMSDLRDLEWEKALLGLLDQTAIPDEDTVGPWLRRMGDPEKTQTGLVGPGKVKDEFRPPPATTVMSGRPSQQECRGGLSSYRAQRGRSPTQTVSSRAEGASSRSAAPTLN